ncbi:MAG: DUF2782 domain-containing protein [Thioalkalispiraceae bacterium]|jgi:hypothetical protein
MVTTVVVYAEDAAAPPRPGENTQSSEEAVSPPPSLPPSTGESEAASSPPPPPSTARESDDSRNIPRPEVNIIQRKDMRIEEYRVNGRLRYVKITPKKGKPYYLVDKDGDGDLETRHDDLDGVPPINEWILLEW